MNDPGSTIKTLEPVSVQGVILPAEEVLSPLMEEIPPLTAEEARLLGRHFEIFTETTNKLVAAHQHLQEQVRSLLQELEYKNRQLEAVNRELAHRIQETEEVKDFLDRVIDSMQTGLVAFDSEGNVTRINRAACQLLGWSTGAPSRFEQVSSDSPSQTTPTPKLRLSFYPEETSRSGETRLRKKDGETILVRYTTVPILRREGRILSGEAPQALTAPLRPDSVVSTYHLTRQSGSLLVFEDLSQLRLLEEKVRRANRLTALGELAAGVAHEMRNPLATMRGFLQLLPSEYEDPEFREECSTRLIREIDRLARLTESLLELSRPIRPDEMQMDLAELVNEVLNEQKEGLLTENVEVQSTLSQVPLLPLDRDRIKQVLLNLVLNARQAMHHEPKILEIELKTCQEPWGNEDTLSLLATLSVRDNGKGIESRHLDNIFDPFFTTRDEGTGLGLALCHRIVEDHGGVIRVSSNPGKGSSFTLYFPINNTGGVLPAGAK